MGKEYNKAVYCHPVYLTPMKSTSCEILDWMKHVRIKIARRNINNIRYADDIALKAESEEELQNHLMRVKEKSERSVLKLSVKTKIMASSPITSWQTEGEKLETVAFTFLGPQNHYRW